MKTKIILLGSMLAALVSSAQTTIIVNGELYNPQQSILFTNIAAEVKAVYPSGVLLNWTERKPIYGKSQSNSPVSEGNSGLISPKRPIVGYTLVHINKGMTVKRPIYGQSQSASPVSDGDSGPISPTPPIVGYEKAFSKDILVLNLPYNAAEGEKLSFRAMQVGTTNFDGSNFELWDCGAPPTPGKLKQIEDEEAKAQALIEQQKAASHKAAQAEAAEHKKKGVEAALKYNQDEAAKGDAYGLLRMGERYRDGDGVGKDLAIAKEYLQKAAAAGSPDAAEELSKLKH